MFLFYLERNVFLKTDRVFLVVLDSFGIGELPDAADYGDEGANTLRSVRSSGKLFIPNLKALGLYSIDGVGAEDGEEVNEPLAAHCKLKELSAGKDTIIGHHEICGLVAEHDLPTYKNGFPDEIIEEFKRLTGRDVLCNKPYSGTEVIKDYGEEHIKSGSLIVYTSADSVFQVAAHEEVVPVETLYSYCEQARKMLKGEHGVGRVIARPFVGKDGVFTRTANRHDYSLVPPKDTLLDFLKGAGLDVIGVGKISDIFAGRGVTESYKTKDNTDGMNKLAEIAKRDFNGLCFVNLVDFDSVYGHRNDVEGYAKALNEFDSFLNGFLPLLRENDVLFITADHGCDPGHPSTDHTREHIPLLVYGKAVKPVNLGTRESFADIGKTVAHLLGVETEMAGESFAHQIL